MSTSNSPVAVPSFDAQELLDSAEKWRTAARTAIASGDWEHVEPALNMAETSYTSARGVAIDGTDLRKRVERGLAMCTVLRSDVALRRWQLPDAEARLDEAYKAFKALEEGVIGAELWRVTARLAERQGRWRSAKAAWKRVAKVTEGKDEVALGDALVRVAEVEIVDGKPGAAEDVLLRAEALVRDLDDDLLRARVLAVRAAELESQRNYAASWEVYQDAQASITVAPQDFQGLLKLRMAGTAVWMKPRQAFRLLESGYEALVEAKHPDALGLTLHQLAILALAVRDADAAALATMGARACRGGYDETSRPMLVQALRQGGHTEPADALEAEESQANDDIERLLVSVLEPVAEAYDLKWLQIGTEEAMLALSAALRRRDRSGVKIRVEGEKGWLVDDQAALVRHRATLTWDAPVDTLGVDKPPPPKVAPTPPPIPRRQVRPKPPATRPPPQPPMQPARAVPTLQMTPVNLLLAAFSVILFVAGGTILGLIIFIRFVLPTL